MRPWVPLYGRLLQRDTVIANRQSLRLLIPWAKVRLAAFRAKSLTLHVSGTFLAETLLDEEANALGEGMSDLGDFDVGIGA